MNSRRSTIALSGVPETMLWPLWNRAAETRRKDRLIDDPMSADLVERIDYDFARNFGKPTVFHPIRARTGDDLIRDYSHRTRQAGVVVALGEGLETQLWRLGEDAPRWISVDVPEAIDTRECLLPAHPRSNTVAASAMDLDWMDAVPDGAPPFISAAGLLMYFTQTEVRELLTRIAARFPGCEMYFDTITPYFSKQTLRSLKVTKHYTVPPMPWGVTIDDLRTFLSTIPGIEVVSIRSYADPFPKRTRLYKLLSHVGPVRRRFAAGLVHVRTLPQPDGGVN